jgi:hypothetical protein
MNGAGSTTVMLLDMGSGARGGSLLPEHTGSFELSAFTLGSAADADPERPVELRVQLAEGTQTSGLTLMQGQKTVMEAVELLLGLLEPETRRVAPLMQVVLYDVVVSSTEDGTLSLHAVQATAGSLEPDLPEIPGAGGAGLPEPAEMSDSDFDFRDGGDRGGGDRGGGDPGGDHGEGDRDGGGAESGGLGAEGGELQVT